MTSREIALHRLVNQQIAGSTRLSPGEIVARLGAIQAQDYLGALWAVGLRSPGTTEADVEEALARREIVRTWPMRGTLHFVAAADARWMLELLTPRVITASATRHKQLELDHNVFARSEKIFRKALGGNRQRTREEMMGLLEEAGISTANQRGYHILSLLAQHRVLCFGPRQGKQQTFVLFEEWIPQSRSLPREEALAELALRYFISHGPAKLTDFAGWSGLKITEARRALASISSRLTEDEHEGSTYWMSSSSSSIPSNLSQTAFLLPGFDEYLLGYKDRNAVLNSEHAPFIIPGKNGMFQPTMVKGGKVVGVWKRSLQKNAAAISTQPFTPLSAGDTRGFSAAAKHYGRFIGVAGTVFSA